MPKNAVRILFAGLLIFSSALASAEAEKDYVWRDEKGLALASPCKEVSIPAEQMPFRVLTPLNAATAQSMVVHNRGDVAVSSDALVSRIDQKSLRIISPGKGPDWQRGLTGVLPSASLMRLQGQILYTTKVPQKAQRLERTFWMLEIEDGKIQAFSCPQVKQPFFIFNVYLRDGSRSAVRVGVNGSDTQILQNAIVVRSVQEALDLDANLVTQFMGLFGFKKDAGDDGGEEAEGEDQGSEEEEGEGGTSLIDGPISGPINDLIRGSGQHTHIACKEKDGIYVRGDSLDKVLFETGRFERVFVLQGFGGPVRRKHSITKEGVTEEFTFIKVQLPDRPAKTGQAVTGWVAETGIALETECKFFQDSLKNVVCMGEGSAVMRDSKREELARIEAGKEVMLLNDWSTRREKWEIGGKEFDFVPVMVPGLGLKDGWMALEFLKPEAVCKAQAEGSGNSPDGLNDPGCCNFPMNQPAGGAYKQKGDGGLGRYFGAPRRDKTRLHAGVDLLAAKGTSVYAVADGTVLSPPRDFLKSGTVWTQILDVKQKGGWIFRYGELDFKRGEFQTGSRIKINQKIGKVSRTNMLHAEMYDGTGSGAFYVARTAAQKRKKVSTHERRSDLMNPFPHVHKWEVKKFGSKAP